MSANQRIEFARDINSYEYHTIFWGDLPIKKDISVKVKNLGDMPFLIKENANYLQLIGTTINEEKSIEVPANTVITLHLPRRAIAMELLRKAHFRGLMNGEILLTIKKNNDKKGTIMLLKRFVEEEILSESISQ